MSHEFKWKGWCVEGVSVCVRVRLDGGGGGLVLIFSNQCSSSLKSFLLVLINWTWHHISITNHISITCCSLMIVLCCWGWRGGGDRLQTAQRCLIMWVSNCVNWLLQPTKKLDFLQWAILVRLLLANRPASRLVSLTKDASFNLHWMKGSNLD